MNVQLKNLPLNEELIQAVRRWENDPAISPFITPHYLETSELPLVTESDVRESLSKNAIISSAWMTSRSGLHRSSVTFLPC